jgi:long-chain acyl-CoA synthetase
MNGEFSLAALRMQSVALPKPWLKFYPDAVPKSIEIPQESVQTLLVEAAKHYPNSYALNFQGRKITYKQLNELSNQFANGLLSLGLQKGSRIAIILPNLPQFSISFWGALKAGLIVVPCNPVYREREIEYQLNDSGAEAVVILNNIYRSNDFFAEFEKARPRLANIKHVFTTSLTDFLPPIKKQLAGRVRKIQTVEKIRTIRLVDFLGKNSKADPPSFSISPVEDIAVLQYTGGTTGISKGAMLTHLNLVSNAVVLSKWSQYGHDEKMLGVTPFFHIYGLTCCMISPVVAGVEVVLLPSFNVREVLETIQKEKITTFPGVSTMYIAIVNFPELSKYSIGTIRTCVSGAAPLPLEVQKKFNALTGGNLVEGYGLSETSPVTHSNPLGNNVVVKSGSIGIPIPDTDAKIVDAETGTRDLAVGEEGELAVLGPQVMKGYWGNPKETADILKNGWLLTGDIAKMDEDGYFYILDRKKDLINASGFKVYPREVEEILYSHPDIKEAAVIGVKDEYRGETVKAFIVLKDKNRNPGVEAIQEYCKKLLAPYKAPKVIEFRDELPKTLVGKVLRRKLREQGTISS